ncbi:hypothetical protein P3L10_002789 [Capsicum annuum]
MQARTSNQPTDAISVQSLSTQNSNIKRDIGKSGGAESTLPYNEAMELNITNFPWKIPLDMSWLFWNVRGVNKRYKQREVKKFLSNKHIKLAGLIETRVKEHKYSSILNLIVPGWGSINNYNAAENGRIWVVWDKNHCDVTALRKENHAIHCKVHQDADIKCFLTVVYGFNIINQRRNLWEYQMQIALTVNGPWMICRDFNALLDTKDRLSGNPVQFDEIKDFAECVQNL